MAVVEQALNDVRPQAFEDELLKHLDAMYTVALRLTRNPTDAQDLLQDAVVRALRFHHKFKEGTYLKAWLLTILRNTFINDYRRRLRRPTVNDWAGLEAVPNMAEDPAMGYYPEELKAKHVLETLDANIRIAVDKLPDGHRQTLIMADLQDMSYREIADVMKCPLGTVMSRLHRGRRLLREALDGCRHGMAFG